MYNFHRGKTRFKMRKGTKPRQVKSVLFPGTMIDGTRKGRLSGKRPKGYDHGPSEKASQRMKK